MTEILKKEPMLASSGRIDKCPTPMGFYDKLPTTRTDKMTNARQMPEGDGHVTSLRASEAEHVVQTSVMMIVCTTLFQF